MQGRLSAVPAPAVDRYAALALRRDISLGVLLSTHPRDFAVVLAAAAQAFQGARMSGGGVSQGPRGASPSDCGGRQQDGPIPECPRAGRTFNEREVNALLRDFQAGAGSMLVTDHVELRRWLVDFHLLDRDGYGRAYTAGTPAAEIADLVRQLAGVDLVAVARAAREGEGEAARRAERKARWQSTERSSGG